MAELKTQKNEKSVTAFLESVQDEGRRKDSFVVLDLMEKATGEKPFMWGDSIVGYGQHHYKYASGHEGDWPLAAFSPRKQNLTLYILPGFDHYEEILSRLGKYKTAKSCLYINRLSDVDLDVLKELVQKSADYIRKRNPPL